MKTNRFARVLVRVRLSIFFVTVIGMAAAGFHLGDGLAERHGEAAAARTDVLPVPNVNVHYLMAAAQ